SLHREPLPRTGGLGIWCGLIVGMVGLTHVYEGLDVLPWIGGAALLDGVVSFIDDWSNMPVLLRLPAHAVAAAALILGGLGLQIVQVPGAQLHLPPLVGIFLTVLFILWMINLYNFMDGIDGLAGGMAAWGFGALGVLGYLAGS